MARMRRLPAIDGRESPGRSPTRPRAVVGTGIRLEVQAPEADGDYLFVLRTRDVEGQEDVARTALTVRAGKVSLWTREAGPSWLAEAVVYGVVPPLFGDPPLSSVEKALGRLAELGVNTLWLSPIFATTPDDFGYAVTHLSAVRSDYGSTRDLAELVRTAHRLGLRVLLDLVVNHTSREHPYFVQAEQRGERSHYVSFYDRDVQGSPTHYFDWSHLPNLNYGNPEVRRWVQEVSDQWVRDFDVDGYRVDAAWGVKERAPDYWSAWARELHRVKPGVLLLAEASARDPYYLQHGFDAAYDWTDELGHPAWEKVFGTGQGIVARLDAALDQTERAVGRMDRVFRSLNNNDTGQRFIGRHGDALNRVATALLLTLPGIPCLYTFDEVGADFEPYQQLTPISKHDPGLRAYHQQLLRLRHDSQALHAGDFRPLLVDEAQEVYVFLRGDAEHSAVVALNFSAHATVVRVAPPSLAKGAARRLRELLTGAISRVRRGELKLELSPWEVEIWQPE